MRKVTASHSLRVRARPEQVWDFTQNWNRRPEWDFSVVAAKVIKETPRTVWVHARGGLEIEVVYKLWDRPKLTTLAMKLHSPLVRGGGGSWKYEPSEDGTLWTQHNTLELRGDFLGAATAPFFARFLRFLTRRMMEKAKQLIEEESAR